MRTVIYAGHRVDVDISGFTGTERVFYDGKEVSCKWSAGGANHLFGVVEDGQAVQYEADIRLRWHMLGTWVVVRRNGITIFSDR